MASFQKLCPLKKAALSVLIAFTFLLLSPDALADAGSGELKQAPSMQTSSGELDDGEDFEIDAEEDVLYLDQEPDESAVSAEELEPAQTVDTVQRICITIAVISFGIFAGLLTFIIVSFRISRRRKKSN